MFDRLWRIHQYQKDAHTYIKFPSCGAHYHAWFDLLFRTPIHYFHDFRCFSLLIFGSGHSCHGLCLVYPWFIHTITAVSTEYGFQTPQAPVRMSWAESDKNVEVIITALPQYVPPWMFSTNRSHTRNLFSLVWARPNPIAQRRSGRIILFHDITLSSWGSMGAQNRVWSGALLSLTVWKATPTCQGGLLSTVSKTAQ